MNTNNVHLTVATVIERDNKFLMVREHDSGKEVYNQPAGHWEIGESIVEAAVRETLEETGVRVELSAFLGLFMSQSESGDNYCRLAFSANALEVVAGATLDADIIAAEWLSLRELHDLRDKMRSPLVMQTLQVYQSGQRFDLSAVDSYSSSSFNPL